MQPVQLSLLPDQDPAPAVTITRLPAPDTSQAVALLAGLIARAALTPASQPAALRTGGSNAVA